MGRLGLLGATLAMYTRESIWGSASSLFAFWDWSLHHDMDARLVHTVLVFGVEWLSGVKIISQRGSNGQVRRLVMLKTVY